VYPGDPDEYAGPTLQIDRATYRKVALHRPAYHSGGYDYKLTAQLVTDGLVATELPRWVSVATSEHGVLPKHQREWLLDDNGVTSVDLNGPPSGWSCSSAAATSR
jgi:hypothetical protein